MFRAPCMSQRRLALIFCVSILIVLLVALILLCEWGPSLGWCRAPWGSAEGGTSTRGSAIRKPRCQEAAGREALFPFPERS